MSKFKNFVVRSTLIAATLGLGVFRSFAVDVGHGEQLARRWCASCHIVADDQTVGADSVPTFAAIAKRPNFSVDELARFLRDPHPVMPDMQLSASESADISGYIASLTK